jgi:hypothetical protein
MKHFKNFIAMVIVVSLICTAGLVAANAADQLINSPIESVVTKIDKNGQSYTRFIIEEERTLNGTSYTTTVAVMAFGDMAQVAKQKNLSKGNTLRAIVTPNVYNGRTSYNILSFVD